MYMVSGKRIHAHAWSMKREVRLQSYRCQAGMLGPTNTQQRNTQVLYGYVY